MEKTITFKQESFVFANSLNEYIINKNKEKMSHFSDDKNTYSLHHGRSMGNSNEILDSELTKHSVEVTYDINDVLELYNIKKYIDNNLYLKDWSQEDIKHTHHIFKKTAYFF